MISVQKEQEFEFFNRIKKSNKSAKKMFFKIVLVTLSLGLLLSADIAMQYHSYEQKYLLPSFNHQLDENFNQAKEKVILDMYAEPNFKDKNQHITILVNDVQNLLNFNVSQDKNIEILQVVEELLVKNNNNQALTDNIKSLLFKASHVLTAGIDKDILLSEDAKHCKLSDMGCKLANWQGLAQELQNKVLIKDRIVEHMISEINDNTIGEHL